MKYVMKPKEYNVKGIMSRIYGGASGIMMAIGVLLILHGLVISHAFAIIVSGVSVLFSGLIFLGIAQVMGYIEKIANQEYEITEIVDGANK